MRLVYLASAIDQAREQTWTDNLAAILAELPATVIYRPSSAFWLLDASQPDPRLEQINREALLRADALVAVVQKGVASVGVPREIELAASTGIPWAVLTDLYESFSLADALHTEPLTEQGMRGIRDWVESIDPNWADSRNYGQLLFAKDPDFDGQLPTRAHDGDAGFDLYVAQDVLIPAGAFRDVPCGVRVALPTGTVAEIRGRSSTLRKRALLVSTGTIDNGWRGPLFAGVQNMGEKSEQVCRGERIAQLVLAPNLASAFRPAWASSTEFSAIPHDGRGEQGFGSTGF